MGQTAGVRCHNVCHNDCLAFVILLTWIFPCSIFALSNGWKPLRGRQTDDKALMVRVTHGGIARGKANAYIALWDCFSKKRHCLNIAQTSLALYSARTFFDILYTNKLTHGLVHDAMPLFAGYSLMERQHSRNSMKLPAICIIPYLS